MTSPSDGDQLPMVSMEVDVGAEEEVITEEPRGPPTPTPSDGTPLLPPSDEGMVQHHMIQGNSICNYDFAGAALDDGESFSEMRMRCCYCGREPKVPSNHLILGGDGALRVVWIEHCIRHHFPRFHETVCMDRSAFLLIGGRIARAEYRLFYDLYCPVRLYCVWEGCSTLLPELSLAFQRW